MTDRQQIISGSGNGQFNDPGGIAVDQVGNVYVVDEYNNRVQKFDSNGKFITAWSSAQFQPSTIAVDSVGYVFVVDYGNKRVQEFDSNGTFIRAWGSSGSGNGQFQGPMGIAVDSAGNVYVADQPTTAIWIGSCLQVIEIQFLLIFMIKI
jgi:tripartite motif-containing protein 71